MATYVVCVVVFFFFMVADVLFILLACSGGDDRIYPVCTVVDLNRFMAQSFLLIRGVAMDWVTALRL